MMGCWLLVLLHESLVRWLSLLRDDHHQHHQLAEKVLGWSFFGGGAISLSPCKNLVHLRKKAGRSVRYAVRFQPTGGKLAPRYHQVTIANGRYDFSNKSSLSWKNRRNHTQCFRTIRSWHDGNVKQYIYIYTTENMLCAISSHTMFTSLWVLVRESHQKASIQVDEIFPFTQIWKD